MTERVLVAGIGNIFRSDDGFGCAVAEALAGRPLPPCVEVVDYGIRGLHLALDLERSDGGGIDALILVDTVPEAGGGPGSVAVIEIDHERFEPGRNGSVSGGADDAAEAPVLDAHGMDPGTVLASVAATTGRLPPTHVVGCQPATTAEGIGLSEIVAAAVPVAAATVLDLVERLHVTSRPRDHTPIPPGGTA